MTCTLPHPSFPVRGESWPLACRVPHSHGNEQLAQACRREKAHYSSNAAKIAGRNPLPHRLHAETRDWEAPAGVEHEDMSHTGEPRLPAQGVLPLPGTGAGLATS